MDARSRGYTETTDPVAQMRRRLDELLADGGAVTGSARGPRPDEPDPQRVRPAGFGAPDDAPLGGRTEDDAPGGIEQAKESALRLLAVRARSRAELAQRLSAKGYSPEVTEQVLDRLAEVGLIDDADFARQWVRQRHGFSGKGRRALEQELRRKGVSQEDSAAALEGVTADDEYERATELVRRKLRSLPAGLDREKAIRRLVGMLARRGYGHSVAYAVVKSEYDAAGFGDEEVPPD